jgi:hypothetical protein
MFVAGVALSVGSVAWLALQLNRAGHTDLATRVGLAVDANTDVVRLNRKDRGLILAVLDRCPNGLISLRDALRAT